MKQAGACEHTCPCFLKKPRTIFLPILPDGWHWCFSSFCAEFSNYLARDLCGSALLILIQIFIDNPLENTLDVTHPHPDPPDSASPDAPAKSENAPDLFYTLWCRHPACNHILRRQD
ncbi:MAG: hypothetical protein ACE15F_14070, partial [bacterium]